MIKSKKIFLIFLWLWCISCLFVFCTGQEKDPDSWEDYQNWRQPPEKVMKAIGIRPGMVIGEIGAGRGRYAVRLAARVGKTGKIYANDILKSKLDYLEFRCKRDNISNITTILGELTDSRFPKGDLDMIFIINTYHHIDNQVALLKNAVPALKPGGTLVIVECDPKKGPNMGSHSTPKDVLIKEVSTAGLELVRIETVLSQDNIYIFRVKK